MVWPIIAAAVPAAMSAIGAGGAAAGGAGLLGGGAAAGGGGLLSGLGSAGGGSLFSMGGGGGLSMGADLGLGMGSGTDPLESIGGDMMGRIDALGSGMGGVEPEPEIPKPPPAPGPDMSGFANAGLTPPALWDAGQFMPQNQISGLMSMATAGDPHAQSRIDPVPQRRSGGLMSYLETLGAV